MGLRKLIIIFLFISSTVYAQGVSNRGLGTPRLVVKERGGAIASAPRTLVFPDDALYQSGSSVHVHVLTSAIADFLYLRLDCSNDPLTAALDIAPDTDITCSFGKWKMGYDGTNADFATISHYDAMAWNTFALGQDASANTYLNGDTILLRLTDGVSYAKLYSSAGDERFHIVGDTAWCIGGSAGSERVFFRESGTDPTLLTMSTPYSNLGFVVEGLVQTPTINGGTAANDDITIQGTTNATRTTSYVNLQPNGGYVGIGLVTPTSPLTISGLLDGSTAEDLLKFKSTFTASAGKKYIAWEDPTDILGGICVYWDGISQSKMDLGSLYYGGYNRNAVMTLQGNGNVDIGGTSAPARLSVTLLDTTTNSVSEVQRITHSGGTVANGFGSGLDFYLEDATAATIQQASRIGTLWTDATDATRTSAITFSGVTSGGSLAEWMRVASGFTTLYNGNILQVNSAGDDKNIQVYHDDSNACIVSSSGQIRLVTPTFVIINASGNKLILQSDANTPDTFITTFNLVSSDSTDQTLFGLEDSGGNQLIITNDVSSEYDHDHATTTNPTFFIHSDLNPNISNNQWGSFAHDQENFVITTGVNVGTGTAPTTDDNAIIFAPRGAESGRFDSDATAGNTRFMLYDVDNGTMERVSVGDADSGGAGYKVLRIAN